MLAVLGNNRTRAAFGAACALLAVVYAARFDAYATSGQAVYAFGLILTVAAALVAGGAALGRFHAARRDSFLLVSAGLWVAAALHLVHFAAYTGVFGAAGAPLAAAAVQRGALLPALFFSFFLGLSLLASRQNRPSSAEPAGVFLAAATLAFIVTVAALVFPAPSPDAVAWVVGQPLPPLAAQPELLLAAALTLGGIGGLLRGGRWRAEPFARWSLFALIVTLVALARLPLLNAFPLEALLLVAQGLVVASYGCVFVGSMTGARARETVAAPKMKTAQPAAPSAARAPTVADAPPVSAPERALHDLQASHRALRNATDGVLLCVRADGTLTDWKPAADFGPTTLPSDLLGKNIAAVLPSDQAEALLAAVGRVLQGGKTERLRYSAADGSAALGVSVTPRTADEALCVISDQTARARALQELDTQRRVAASLRRVTGDWLIQMTRAGAIQDLQPPAGAETATYADVFAGKHVGEVFQGDDVSPLLAAAEAALAGDAVQEFSFVRSSGQALAVRVAPYADDAVLCRLRDVSELEEATAQLQESEETNQVLRAHFERLQGEQAHALAVAEESDRALRSLLPDLLLRVRADGTILECKPAESFGPRDGQGIVDAKARAVLPVDLASQLMAAIERARRDGQPQRFACHPVGGQALAGGVAALAADQFLCLVRDLTQQKQMETALAQQAAILAREMQAKLEAESLKSLRAENDALRARLLHVAQLALESGPAAAPTTESAPGATDAADEAPTQTTEASSPPTGAPPAQSPAEPEALSPPDARAGKDTGPAAPDFNSVADLPANGKSPRAGNAAAGRDDAPQNSAGGLTTDAAMRAGTAVATPPLPAPHTTANGQAERSAAANGKPTEEVRLS